MDARKVVAGSVLAAGLGVAGMMGAGTALAGPGISFDNGTGGTGAIGIGDRSATGAQAIASTGNRALAVNLGGSKGSLAIADGKNNNVVAINGVAVTGPGTPGSVSGTKNNNVVAAFGNSTVDGTAHNNNVVTVGGKTGLGADNHGNTVLNVGGRVATALAQEDDPGALLVSACGTSFSGQADQIKVTDIGICSGAA